MWFFTLAALFASQDPSVVFDARDLNWEERCTVEALQGLVNREGARLYLNQGYAWDQRWIGLYEKRNGLRLEGEKELPKLLDRFREDVRGLVVYDPCLDGSRYVALTLAGLKNLLPVSPELLDGSSPSLRASAPWSGMDFTQATERELGQWRPVQVDLSLAPGKGMSARCTGGEEAPWGFASWGPFRVDLDATPFLEVEADSVEGEGTKWLVKLTWDRDKDGYVAGGEDDLCFSARTEPGVARWNVAAMAGVQGMHRFSLIQLHVFGRGGKVRWRSARFVAPDGSSVQKSRSKGKGLAELGFPVRFDLRGRFEDSPGAYRWALEEWMPNCHPRMAHAVNGTVDGMRVGCGPFAGFDWPVMHRAFVFNLACNEEDMSSYGDTKVAGDPVHASLYRRILESLDPLAQITGYGEPEGEWCKLISQHGHYSFHFGNNWSFHHRVPSKEDRLRQKVRFTMESADENPDRFYVCFMTSEGDTMKGTVPFFYESWFDPARGTVPMNWGINPLMAELFPAMISYYYDTATEDDYFFTGCSGAGYCYPDSMPNADEFAAFTGEMCRTADTPCIDLWGAKKRDVIESYAEKSGCLGLTINAAPAALTILPSGVPVAFHGLAYWQHEAVGGSSFQSAFEDDSKRAEAVHWLVDQIEKIARRHDPPFVILVYADLHHYAYHSKVHAEVAAALDPDRFQPARLDEALAGVRTWANKRVLVGSDAINQRLRLASLVGVETELPLVLRNGLSRSASTRVSLSVAGKTVSAEIDLDAGETGRLDGLNWLAEEEGTFEGHLEVEGANGRLRRPCQLAGVAVPLDCDKARFVSSWAASPLRHAAGEATKDAEALWGEAWLSPTPPAEACHILFGPYADVPEGEYIVAFRLAQMEDENGSKEKERDAVATLEVYAGGYDGLGRILAKRTLACSELLGGGQWQWFALETKWPGPPSQMETRILWQGGKTLKLDRVVLFEKRRKERR